MRRKRSPKSKVSTKSKPVNEDSWRTEIETLTINDDQWWCIIAMMVETRRNHSKFVSVFNDSTEEGKRKAIHSLSHQKMLANIRTLSKQSFDKVPAIQGVCHYASKVLAEENNTMPTWLMARVIKYLIYRAREDNIGIVKRLADLEREIDEEYWIMQTVADWGQPGSKGFNAEKFNNKANTRLRKRNEEWRDAIFINDAPLDGPNLYIILTGFHDPDLPESLIEAGVPLTTVVPIKRPKEQFYHFTEHEILEDSALSQETLLEYTSSRPELFKFWMTIHERWEDYEAHPLLCDVAFPVFCPPDMELTYDEDEYKNQKKVAYDQVSYFLYDLYDLHRQHRNYLKSMKVEDVADDIKDTCDKTVYESLLDSLPADKVSVALILFAILMQVTENEENGEKESNDLKDDKSELQGRASSNIEEEAETADPSTTVAVKQKLSSLNIKFSLIEENHADRDQQNATDIELILHGDSLSKTIRLNKSANFTVPSGFLIDILPLFWHPGIMGLHSKYETPKHRLEKYSHHIDGTQHYFDVKINNEEVRHYLHILMFDRLFFGVPRVAKKKNTESWTINSNNSSFSLKHSKSVPSLKSLSMQQIHFHSDGKIDYTKTALKLTECSPLFDLIDPRELLVPGYLLQNVFNRKCTGDLHEFDDVELLASAIFLQRVHQCLLSFDRFEAFYFEPTDSVLLRFTNDWKVNDVQSVETVSNIRTPVCLRDFCQYVLKEEEDWIRLEEEENRLKTSESMGRLMRKVQEMYEETMLFRDEDFILPGSLKAKDLERIGDSAKGKKSEADTLSATASEERTKGRKRRKGKARGEPKEKRKRSTNKKKLNVEKESPSTLEESSRVDDNENVGTYEFIGYDLGRLRVQVTNRVKTFLSADGTLVRVAMDDWLYENKDLRVTVTIRGNSLRLFRRIGGSEEAGEVFHMTNKAGAIVSFEKQFQLQRYAWSRSVDFRASWPSGLTIEPISCEEPENPFYIHQSYITKNSDANQEVCRKFLRNGTVLKYLTNGDIVVLRPNGAIVTCTAFQNLHLSEDEVPAGETDIAKGANGNTPSKEPKAPIINKRKPSALKSQLAEVVEVGPTLTRKDSTTSNVMDRTVKVSRYTVLDHDGQWYEVADDLVVSEYHRLLVRTASDYEVDEKFTRRADGTDMLLKSNGELIVGFPDGTRITTGYTIEEEPVMCDWTEEEIQRYFASEWTKGEEGYAPVSSLKQVERDSPRSSAEYENDMTDIDEILIADGFVSVLLTCRAEHKKYATVFYDQSAVSCALSMPDDLRVSISRRGHYEVSMADGVNLKIKDDSLSLRGSTCTSCGSQSTSSYKFISSDSPDIIFTTVDVFGNTFEVLDNGSTRYHRNSQPEPCELNGNVDFAEGFHEEGGSEEGENGSRENLRRKRCCRHESIRRLSNGTRYRIFSVNRDLTAYEYLHRSVVSQAELAAVFDNEASVILYRSPRRPELRRLITFETVEPESPSKELLSLQEYKVKPTNFDRRDLIRSTYSIPYDWKFPFGKNGDGIWKNTHDLPLTSNTDLVLPELLQIRILCNFKKSGGNAVIDIQRALGRYWMSLVSDTGESSITADEQEEERQGNDKSISRHLEDSLQDLALGIRNTIDSATYKLGLERRQVPKVKAAPTSSKLEELLRQRAADQETIEWYKRCMRERIIIPYFQNVAGTCFLVVKDCVEMATELSQANGLPDECNESEELCGTCHQAGKVV